MKRIITIILAMLFCIGMSSAQDESVKPTRGVKFDRPVAKAIINGEYYEHVIVLIEAADYNDRFESVRIVIRDSITNKKIYRKILSKSCLYAYSDGTIEIGKGNALTQMVLYKKENKEWWMEFREMGLY